MIKEPEEDWRAEDADSSDDNRASDFKQENEEGYVSLYPARIASHSALSPKLTLNLDLVQTQIQKTGRCQLHHSQNPSPQTSLMSLTDNESIRLMR